MKMLSNQYNRNIDSNNNYCTVFEHHEKTTKLPKCFRSDYESIINNNLFVRNNQNNYQSNNDQYITNDIKVGKYNRIMMHECQIYGRNQIDEYLFEKILSNDLESNDEISIMKKMRINNTTEIFSLTIKSKFFKFNYVHSKYFIKSIIFNKKQKNFIVLMKEINNNMKEVNNDYIYVIIIEEFDNKNSNIHNYSNTNNKNNQNLMSFFLKCRTFILYNPKLLNFLSNSISLNNFKIFSRAIEKSFLTLKPPSENKNNNINSKMESLTYNTNIEATNDLNNNNVEFQGKTKFEKFRNIINIDEVADYDFTDILDQISQQNNTSISTSDNKPEKEINAEYFNITEEEWNKIRKWNYDDLSPAFQENFKALKTSLLSKFTPKNFFHEDIGNNKFNTQNNLPFPDDELVRYILGYKGNTELAETSLSLLFDYRKNFKPLQLDPNSYNFSHYSFFYIAGSDKYNRPIVHFKVKEYNADKSNYEEFQRHIIYTLESAIRKMPPYIAKYLFVVDLKDAGMKNFSFAQMKELKKVTDKMYVERLGTTYIINKGFMFNFAWKLVSPILAQSTKEKIVVADQKIIQKMKELFNEEAVNKIFS